MREAGKHAVLRSMRMPKFIFVCGALLALTSCQPPTFDIITHGTVDRLIFTARGSGIWLFRSDDEIDVGELTIRDRERVMWTIRRVWQFPCDGRNQSYPFPIVYGQLPKCYGEIVAPVPLKTGTLYRADSDGIRSGSGLFRVVEQTQSLEWNDVQEEIGNWRDIPEPEPPVQPSDNAR